MDINRCLARIKSTILSEVAAGGSGGVNAVTPRLCPPKYQPVPLLLHSIPSVMRMIYGIHSCTIRRTVFTIMQGGVYGLCRYVTHVVFVCTATLIIDASSSPSPAVVSSTF